MPARRDDDLHNILQAKGGDIACPWLRGSYGDSALSGLSRAPEAHLALNLAASADREIGLQFLNFCLIAQRLYRRWSFGNIGLLPDLGLFCWARPNGLGLACLLVVDTYDKAIGTGLP
jgi:hypothetical protein